MTATHKHNPYDLTVGQLVSIDSFGGLLPGKLIELVDEPSAAGPMTTFATVRLTADRQSYRRGEQLFCHARQVIPRNRIVVRDGQYRILPPMPDDHPRLEREAYGEPYGEGPHYWRGPQLLEMRRKGQRVRFYDMDTSTQVGPEQRNVGPAVAWAHANGFTSYLG